MKGVRELTIMEDLVASGDRVVFEAHGYTFFASNTGDGGWYMVVDAPADRGMGRHVTYAVMVGDHALMRVGYRGHDYGQPERSVARFCVYNHAGVSGSPITAPSSTDAVLFLVDLAERLAAKDRVTNWARTSESKP